MESFYNCRNVFFIFFYFLFVSSHYIVEIYRYMSCIFYRNILISLTILLPLTRFVSQLRCVHSVDDLDWRHRKVASFFTIHSYFTNQTFRRSPLTLYTGVDCPDSKETSMISGIISPPLQKGWIPGRESRNL